MPVKIQTLMQIIESIAPKKLAEDWDNVGLLIGNPNRDVQRVLLALDIDENVVKEAINRECGLIVTHHPLIFKPLKSIRQDLPNGKLIVELIKHDIAVYAAHTNLDAAEGGVNDLLASLLGLKDVAALETAKGGQLYKIVVFVPFDNLQNVRNAMAAAGAGHIGKYSHCSFASEGEGTFLPLEGTKPYIGTQGILERVREYRLETIVEEGNLKKVLAAMLKAHPYEEVAYDVYPLANENVAKGIGRIGKLSDLLTLEQLAQRVKNVLNIPKVKIVGNPHATVSKVAVVGGAGAAYISLAAFKGAQCLVTGDVKYHEAQEAIERNLALIDAGHFETEYPVMKYLTERISQTLRTLNQEAELFISDAQNTPFTFM